jgi:hypothetical protein
MYREKETVLIINWLSYEEKKMAYKKIEKIKDEIDYEWNLCEKAEKDCDKVFSITNEKETEAQNLFSMFEITNKIRKEFFQDKKRICDITKIYVSEKIYKETFEYDYNLMKILYRDKYTSEQARKEVSKLHLSYGLAMSPKIKDNKIHIQKGIFGD